MTTGSRRRARQRRLLWQCACLLFAGAWLLMELVVVDDYRPAEGKPLRREGFVALAYPGVAKFGGGSPGRFSQRRLEEHLAALRAMGYTTITQAEAAAFYRDNAPLPERSLLLLFEDGRRDTAVHAHRVLEANNYIATIMTRAGDLEGEDDELLTADNLLALGKTSYWEVGAGGYRLEYINVYDRYRNFLGALDRGEFAAVAPYLGRDYNHYLMDFIRDEDRLALETPGQMTRRITADYDGMDAAYRDSLGFMPELYVLMHSNTGRFATDPAVSGVNEKLIRDRFALCFNREGSSLNTAEDPAYGLTRMQPGAHWYTNHLIMRVAEDTGEEPLFVTGDEAEAEKWTVKAGAAEFRGDAIVLTSEPGGGGLMRLPERMPGNVEVSVRLDGNAAGVQAIGLASDETGDNGLVVSLEDNVLRVDRLRDGEPVNLYSLDLFLFDGGPSQSVEENEKEGILAYGNAVLRHDGDLAAEREARRMLAEWEAVDAPSPEEGGEGYVPETGPLDPGRRQLLLTLSGDSLTIAVDGRVAIRNLAAEGGEGFFSLRSAASREGSRTDSVYDGVFQNLTVSVPGEGEPVLYAYRLGAFEAALQFAKQTAEGVAQFFLERY